MRQSSQQGRYHVQICLSPPILAAQEGNGARAARSAEQAFGTERQKAHDQDPFGDVAPRYRQLGEKKIDERLPMVRELALSYAASVGA